uniref:Uncharacterized protein n=1 Tax=Anopheles merus TaxID=30066 RepID=A0A182UTN9_ANOME
MNEPLLMAASANQLAANLHRSCSTRKSFASQAWAPSLNMKMARLSSIRLVCHSLVMSSVSSRVGLPLTDTNDIRVRPFFDSLRMFSGLDASTLPISIEGGGRKCSGSSSGSSGSSSS